MPQGITGFMHDRQGISPLKPYIILALLVAAAFANSLPNQFVWDDYWLIVYNRNIDLPLKDIPLLFFKSLWRFAGVREAQELYYRPLLSVFLVLNYKIWGLNPSGFHLVNIVLHLVNSFLVYRIGLLLINSDRRAALIAASLFAVHPVHNESVGRAVAGEPLFGVFALLALYLFLKGRDYVALLPFFCALLTKEFAVMLPLTLLIPAVHREGARRGIIRVAPFVLLAGLYILLRMKSLGSVLGDPPDKPLLVRFYTMASAAFDYLRLLVMPYAVRPYYPGRWYPSISDPKVFASVAALAALGYAAFRVRKDGLKLFLLMSPLLILAPVIWNVNTFEAGGEPVFIAERFLYVPAAFSALLTATLGVNLAGRRREMMTMPAVLLCVLFLALTFFGNRIWRDGYSLFGNVIEEFPNAGFARYNLAVEYYNDGRYQEALREFEEFMLHKQGPLETRHYLELGRVHEGLGSPDRAIEAYGKALQVKPDSAEAYKRIGILSQQQGRLGDAEEAYRNMIKINPDNAEIHNNLGVVLYKLKRLDEAIHEYTGALKLDPGLVIAHYNLGLALEKKGAADEAAREFEKVLSLQPDHANARKRLDSIRQTGKRGQ